MTGCWLDVDWMAVCLAGTTFLNLLLYTLSKHYLTYSSFFPTADRILNICIYDNKNLNLVCLLTNSSQLWKVLEDSKRT